MAPTPQARPVRAAPRLRTRLGSRLPEVVLGLGLAVEAILLLTRVGNGWFGVDALHYLAQRGGIGPATESLWEPYAGHLQPLLIVGYRMAFDLFALDTYLPYVLPGVLVHLGLCAVLYRLTTSLGAHRWAAVAGSLALAYFGRGSEAFLADAPVALTVTLLLGFLAVLVLQRWDFGVRGGVVAAILLLVALTFSNAALTAVVLVGTAILLGRGWRASLCVAAPAVLCFAFWFLTLGRHGDRVPIEFGLLWEVPARALSLLYTPLGSVLGLSEGAAVPTLLVLLAPLVAREAPTRLRHLALAGIAAALTQAVLSAVANLPLGDTAVKVGRYQYVVLAYLLPAVVVALGELLRLVSSRSRGLSGAAVPLAGAAALALVVGVGIGAQQAQWRVTAAEADRARTWTAGGVQALSFGERMLAEDAGGFTVHADDIISLAEAGADQWPALDASPEDRISAESVLFTAVGLESFNLGGPARLSSSSFDRPLKVGLGCQNVVATDVRPEITFFSFGGAQIAVRSSSSSVAVTLDRDGVTADQRLFGTAPGADMFIGTTAELVTVRLSFDAPGKFRICSA